MIISRRKYVDATEWYNEITEEIDKYLVPPYNDPIGVFLDMRTYVLFRKDYPKVIPVRYPGCTRGGIFLDENDVITDIQISPGYTHYCYNSDVDEAVKKFIGRKLIWPEGVRR